MNKIILFLVLGILLLGCAQQGGTSGTGTTGGTGGSTGTGGNGGQIVGVGGTTGGSSGGTGGSSSGSSSGSSATGGSGGVVLGIDQPTPGPDDVTVHISNFAFVPHDVTIKQGHTVFWINEDTTPHTVRIIGVMDSPYISKDGGPFWHTFNEEPGTYNYTCAIHGTMAGTITIVR